MNMLYALTLGLLITQLLDWYSTRTVINSGKGYEANKVAAFFMKYLTMDGFLATKAVAVTAMGFWIGTQAPLVLGACVAFYVIVLINNYKVMTK